MSFGFAVGDFVAVGQLCWKVYKKCKGSPGNYRELSIEVGNLHNVIKETEELLSQQQLTSKQKDKLQASRAGCHEVLEDLNQLLAKYESLGTSSQRTFDRLGYGMQDMNSIRLRLISNVTLLDAFNNASSHSRLEDKLNLLIREIRAGKREGSVIWVQSVDSVARNDRETWEALRSELEDIGISPAIIDEKREFIVEWFREAVSLGKLEEDPVDEDIDSDMGSSGSSRTMDDSDDGSANLGQRASSATSHKVPEHGEYGNRRAEQHRSLEKFPKTPSRPPNTEQKPRSRASYLSKLPLSRESLLCKVIATGNITKAQKLLEKGVLLEARNAEGGTLLHQAALFELVDIMRSLCSRGADLEARDPEGRVPLHLVCLSKSIEGIRMLIGAGANIEAKDEADRTPLHCAARIANVEGVRLLLEAGANIKAKDVDGRTPLNCASRREGSVSMAVLLDAGPDIEARDGYGLMPLHYASMLGLGENVSLLLEAGANTEARGKRGGTPLHFASATGHTENMRLLLQAGADSEARDEDGKTPLHHASVEEDIQIKRVFLDGGFNLRSKDGFKVRSKAFIVKSCVHEASSGGKHGCVQLLLGRGVDVNATDNKGYTALDLTIKNRCHDVEDLLRSKGGVFKTRLDPGAS